MSEDTTIRILASAGVALHLAAPLIGWGLGSQRFPVAIASLAAATATLALMATWRVSLDGKVLAFVGVQGAIIAGAVWWLLLPSGAVAGWVAYGLGLLWLSAFLAFFLFFRLDRLW